MSEPVDLLAALQDSLIRARAARKDPDPEVAAEMSDTHLLVKGERYSFRCACGCNVFQRLEADLFKCNGCGERYESE